MNKLRKQISLFFYRNRDKGIHDLMLYIAIGNIIVYLISLIDQSGLMVNALAFSASGILHGQVWRLVTVVFLDVVTSSMPLLSALFIFFYVWIGRYVEQLWGTCKMNIYYFLGIAVMDIVCLIFQCTFLPGWFHMTLFLIFAVSAPEAQVRLWGILPLRAKYLAWFEIGLTVFDVVSSLIKLHGLLSLPGLAPMLIMPLVPLIYFAIFVGSDIKGLLPDALTRTRTQKNFRNYQSQQRTRTRQQGNPNWANNYQSSTGERPYRHKCTVCGRTDVTNPELEFRYCSKCKGYYCYCMDHINNHIHIQ